MITHAKKSKHKTSLTNTTSHPSSALPTAPFADHRPEAIAQRKLQALADGSAQSTQTNQLRAIADSQNKQTPVQRKQSAISQSSQPVVQCVRWAYYDYEQQRYFVLEDDGQEPIGAIMLHDYSTNLRYWAYDEAAALRGEWYPYDAQPETHNTNTPVIETPIEETITTTITTESPKNKLKRKVDRSSSPEPKGTSTEQDWQWQMDGYWKEMVSGMCYYPATQSKVSSKVSRDFLTDSENTPIKDTALLEKMRAHHEKHGEGAKKEKAKEKELAKPAKKKLQKTSFSVDDYIKERYTVTYDDKVIIFTDKTSKKAAGQIGWYPKDGCLSFDLNKFEKVDGEHQGIGYLMVYALMKYKQNEYEEVQIEAFDSGKGSGKLNSYYQGMGLDSGMHGFVSEVMNACELKAKKLFA